MCQESDQGIGTIQGLFCWPIPGVGAIVGKVPVMVGLGTVTVLVAVPGIVVAVWVAVLVLVAVFTGVLVGVLVLVLVGVWVTVEVLVDVGVAVAGGQKVTFDIDGCASKFGNIETLCQSKVALQLSVIVVG